MGQTIVTVTDHDGDFIYCCRLIRPALSTNPMPMQVVKRVAGLPVVCTAAVGGVPELLQGGAVLTGDAPKEISEAIYSLLTSDEMRRKLLAEAQRIIATWNPPEFFAVAREKILQRCCRNNLPLVIQPDNQIPPKEKTSSRQLRRIQALAGVHEEDRKAHMRFVDNLVCLRKQMVPPGFGPENTEVCARIRC